MTTEHELSTRDESAMVDSLVTRGDWSGLNPAERARVYTAVCKQHGLNPMSQPFAFLRLNGKEVLYANRGATDQLAAMHHVNRKIIDGPKIVDICGTKVALCTAEATLPNGRVETATATLPVVDPVNLYMKLETKAKRRATLSILGLGMMDEMETETIPGAERLAMGAVTLVRDDAPAQLAAPDALAAFRADLDAADGLTLDGAREVYARHDLGGTSLSAVTVALCDALAVRGYRLTAMEAGALLRGEMPAGLALAYDRLAAVDRHADDEDGDAVVASVVMVLRGCGSLPKPAKSRLLKVAAQTVATLLEVDADVAAARLDAALRPPTPPAPTGTDAPSASAPAAADGGSVAPTASAGAQASTRTVLDADEVESRLVTSAAAWAEHLARHVEARSPVFTLAGGYHKRRAAFVEAGVATERYEATLAAIEAREGRGPEAARQALDGYVTRRVLPVGVGEVIHLRSHRQIVAAKRTGTGG